MMHTAPDRPAIVHVSSAHPWTDNRVHYRECASLSAAGFDVSLIAVETDVTASIGDVRVTRIPRRTRVKRILLSAPQAVLLAIRSGAGVVHLHDPELVWAVPVLRMLGRKVIYDAHEDLPVDVLNKPYIPNWARPLLLAFAHLILRIGGCSNRVVAATEAIATRFSRAKTVVIHNYPPLLDGEGAGDLEGRGNAAVYIGAMSAIRGTPQILEAVNDPQFPVGWQLVLAGIATPEVAALVTSAGAQQTVAYHSQLPPDDARQLLSRSKVGLVPLQDTPAYRESLPTKMFEYFAAGLPVVATDFPLWRTIVEQYECGLLVDSASPQEIAAAVARYAADTDMWRQHSENARRLAVNQFNWGPEGERLVRMYRDLVS